MKYIVRELEGPNMPINVSQDIVGNLFLESNIGCYTTYPSSKFSRRQSELLPYNVIVANEKHTIYENKLSVENNNDVNNNSIWTL